MLTTRDLVRIGSCELRSRLHRGELPLRHMGLGARGAMRYHEAVDRGDVVFDAEADRRAGCCSACEHRVDRDVETNRFVGKAHYCGEPRHEDAEKPGHPCTCLVGITIERAKREDEEHYEGVTFATGRAIVASLGCPLLPPVGRPRFQPAEAIGLKGV